MNKYISIFIVAVVVISGIWFFARDKNTESLNKELGESSNVSETPEVKDIINADNEKIIKQMTSATLKTNKGDITIEFFEKEAPKTVANFLKLAKEGFYNGTKFHRVIKGFMIQGGDPLTKDDSKINLWGTGDPGYKFADEIDAKSALYTTGYKKGIVAMANSGPNTNGSQFFIMTEDYPLPPLYTIFGKVASGQEVVDKIANVPTASGDRPVGAVVIESISLK